jgi:hypothetical protein
VCLHSQCGHVQGLNKCDHAQGLSKVLGKVLGKVIGYGRCLQLMTRLPQQQLLLQAAINDTASCCSALSYSSIT